MSRLPLALGHILEEESIRLYGADGGPASRLSEVREEEIIDARGLAQELETRLKDAKQPVPPDIAAWKTEVGHDSAYKQKIAAVLNPILGKHEWLYDNAAFKDAKQSPYASLSDVEDAGKEERFNVNRQMLDTLFPSFLKSGAGERYAEAVKRIHAQGNRTALCISGGGIRSATFALGVMQGLAKKHVLEKFDFVSTVSGGGYIGSWLSSWARRDPWGIRGVAALLASSPADALDAEAPPVQHLRAYSNYLTPQLGITSADTWALVATYLRNLLLNWIVLVPLLAGVLAVPRLLLAVMAFRLPDSGLLIGDAACYSGASGLLLLGISFVTLVSYRPVIDTKRTKWLTDGRFLLRCLLPLLLAAILLSVAWALRVDALGKTGAQFPLKTFIVWSAIPCLIAFGMFLFKYLSASEVEKKHGTLKRIAWEALGAVAAGALGGVLVWVVTTTSLFEQPLQPVPVVNAVLWPIDKAGALSGMTAMYVVFAVPIVLGIFFLQATIFVGASSKENNDFDREWWARASGWVLLIGLVWIALSAIAIYGPAAIYHLPRALSAIGGGAGLFSLLAGKSSDTQAGSKNKGEESKSERVTNFALALAVPLFVIYLLSLISLGTTWALRKATDFPSADPKTVAQAILEADHASREYPRVVASQPAIIKETPLSNVGRLRSVEHLQLIQASDPRIVAGIVFGGMLLAWLVSLCIGVNVFSMHAMYRNRLVRAYLGASRWFREPNTFTGFDGRDNLGMHELRPEYFWWHSFTDIDDAISKLPTSLTSLIPDAIDDLKSKDKSVAQQTLYTALNRLVASKDDLTTGHPSESPLRPLRNRRFIEEKLAAAGIVVYPSPMPLFCAQDVLDEKAFTAAFQAGGAAGAVSATFKHPNPATLRALLDEINEVIVHETYPFAGQTRQPFMLDGKAPRPLIDNRLYIDSLLPRGAASPLAPPRPLHVVNICLNLTGGDELAWQERKGASFTISPLSSGNHRLGYRDTSEYGGISVGTAVTISGAAASPNMGYHSSPALAFLMTIFNVRLGWWLGNPGLAGNGTYKRRNPVSSLAPFLSEATGNTNDKYPYVYLSDGGHFENLGLYEMVLRRAHHIVVCDAGADPKYAYDDLGNAIRKIKIDLGISIEIAHMGIIPPDKKKPGKYCAVATIHYSDTDGEGAPKGELLYIKPVVYEDEGPRDVLNYSATSSDFPHESTADQFFGESQFESYRRLGEFAIDQIDKGRVGKMESVKALIDEAKAYLERREPQMWW